MESKNLPREVTEDKYQKNTIETKTMIMATE